MEKGTLMRSGCDLLSVFAVALAAYVFSVAPKASAAEANRPIELSLDAREAPRRLLHARLRIPAKPGPLTLCYPKWIQGEHQPSGPIADLAGLKMRASGRELPWTRDEVDLFTFRCDVPEGADAVEVSLDYLAPGAKDEHATGGAMTPRLAVLNWYLVLLYPQGRPVREQQVRADLTLPQGWKASTPLPVARREDGRLEFEPVSLETLVDSTVLCGAHLKEVRLGSGKAPEHFLVLACDSEEGLELSDELKAQYERLVAEAGALFGARHYRSYRFLVAMSDQLQDTAIEHHECSDNRVPERFLVDDSYRKLWTGWILPHEYVHSWNGKYRRPAGLATPDFQQPLRTRMLWVYEGLTQYLGFVLTARCGLYTAEVSHENLATIADWAKNPAGRDWRSLEDTTVAAPFLYGARSGWASRRRGTDFYDEGALLWLDVDTLIREKSEGRKSLDDFCRAFFGGHGGPPEVKPYSFEELFAALDAVVAHDWKAFLEGRVKATGVTPLGGLTRSGWKVIYRDKPGEMLKAREAEDKIVDLTASVGLALKEDGTVVDVIARKAADRAGVSPGMKLLGVGDRRWSTERLRAAIAATRSGKPLRLLFENGEFFRTFTLDYADGEKYPALERIADAPDRLEEIFRPRTGQ